MYIVYDSDRGVMVLFGGNTFTTGWNDETWEYDGTNWTLISTGSNHPNSRAYHGMAFDSVRKVTVLYGGHSDIALYDTWEYDGRQSAGARWSQKIVTGSQVPRARIAYDSARQRTILFGGGGEPGSLKDETWAWNGTDWTREFPANSPSARVLQGMAYDSARTRVILFGGWGQDWSFLNDTWEYVAPGSAPTATPTATPTPTITLTPPVTPTPTITPTPSATATPTATPTATATSSPTPTASPTATATVCPTCKADLVIDPPATTIGVGQTFTITLKVEAGSQQVDGVSAYVNFDPTRFQVQAITPDTAKLPITLQNTYSNTLGQINYAAGTFSNYPTGTFAIARVRMIAVAAAENSPFTFQTVQPRKSDVTYAGASILRYLRGATVTAVPVELAVLPASQTVSIGQVFSVTLQAAAGQQPVDTIAAYLDFDPTKVRVTSITPGAILPNVTTNTYDNNAGTLDYVAATASGAVQGAFTVATVYFEALDYTASTALTFHTTDQRRTDARLAGASVLGSTHSAAVTIKTVLSVQPPTGTIGVGEVFTVTLQVKSGSQAVDGASAYLDFDPAVLQVQAITPDTSRLPVTLQNSFNNTAGAVDYAVGAFSNFPSGVFAIAYVRLVAIAEASTTTLAFHTTTPRASDITYGGGSILGALTGASRTVLAGAIVGHLTFQRPNPAPHVSWSVPVTFSFYAAGQPAPRLVATPTTDPSGVFTLTMGVSPGAYDACIKNRHTLQSKVPVTLTWGTNTLNLGTLKEGDANNDNVVSILDFSVLATKFGKCAGTGGYDDRPDFNEDDCVTILDFSSLASNFGQMGATCGGGAALSLSPATQPVLARADHAERGDAGTVEINLLPASSPVTPGEVFTLTIQVAAGAQLVDGVSAYVDFNPTYLQVQAITPDTANLPFTLQNSFDNVTGQINYAAGTLFSFPSGTFVIAQVRFLVAAAPPIWGTQLTYATVNPRKTDATYGGGSVLGATHGAEVSSPVPPPVATATATVAPSNPTTITLPNAWGQVDLPAGVVTGTTVFTYAQTSTPTENPGSFAFAGRSFTMEATDAAGQPITTFASRYTITLNYSDADWQAAGIPAEENLNLYFWNGTAWVAILPCEGCSLDTVNNHITAVLDHLTEFALLGNPLAAPTVSASRDGSGVELRWTQTQDGVARYEVYRSTNPYFTPDGGSLLDGNVPVPGPGNQAILPDPFGEPRVNTYYRVLAVGAGEAKSPASNRVGAFHFGLTPGAQ